MHSKANIAPCCSLEGFMFLNLNILHDRTGGFVIIQKGWATQQPRRAKNIIQSAEKGRKGVDPHERELLLQPTFPLNDMKTSTHDPKRPAEFIVPQTFYTPVQPRLQVSAVQIHPPGNRGLFLLRTEHLTPGDQTLTDAASQSRDFSSSQLCHNQDTLGHAVLGNLAWQAYTFY